MILLRAGEFSTRSNLYEVYFYFNVIMTVIGNAFLGFNLFHLWQQIQLRVSGHNKNVTLVSR